MLAWLVRSALKADVEVALDAAPAAPAGAGREIRLTLRVNGIDVGAHAMAPGSRTYQWQVPARTWLAGTNELWWTTSRAVRPADSGGADTRSLALRVTGLALARK